MPQIIVVAEREGGQQQEVFRERTHEVIFDSEHAARQLLERIGWAVADATAHEHTASAAASDRLAGASPVRPALPDDPPGFEEARDYERSDRVLTTAS